MQTQFQFIFMVKKFIFATNSTLCLQKNCLPKELKYREIVLAMLQSLQWGFKNKNAMFIVDLIQSEWVYEETVKLTC